jgi:hypothetical protein
VFGLQFEPVRGCAVPRAMDDLLVKGAEQRGAYPSPAPLRVESQDHEVGVGAANASNCHSHQSPGRRQRRGGRLVLVQGLYNVASPVGGASRRPATSISLATSSKGTIGSRWSIESTRQPVLISSRSGRAVVELVQRGFSPSRTWLAFRRGDATPCLSS